MFKIEAFGRREFIMSAVACGSIAGCLRTQRDRPGVIDHSDISVQTTGNADIVASNVRKDNSNEGLKISTNDSITDDEVIAEFPTSIQDASKSTVYINADVDEIDDDAEVEIRFQSAESGYRSIYIGNEYKNKNTGVLATKTGTGFGLRKPFRELPGPEKVQSTQIQEVAHIEFVIRDGDFSGKIWDLGFIFKDRTIGIL